MSKEIIYQVTERGLKSLEDTIRMSENLAKDDALRALLTTKKDEKDGYEKSAKRYYDKAEDYRYALSMLGLNQEAK